jgi:hypothetical protein
MVVLILQAARGAMSARQRTVIDGSKLVQRCDITDLDSAPQRARKSAF